MKDTINNLLFNSRFIFQEAAEKPEPTEAQTEAEGGEEVRVEDYSAQIREEAEKAKTRADRLTQLDLKTKGVGKYEMVDQEEPTVRTYDEFAGKWRKMRRAEGPLKGKPKTEETPEQVADSVIAEREAEKEMDSLLGKKEQEESLDEVLNAATEAVAAEDAEAPEIGADRYEFAMNQLRNRIENKDYDLNAFAKNLRDISREINALIARKGELTQTDIDKIAEKGKGQSAEDAESIAKIVSTFDLNQATTSPDKIAQYVYELMVDSGILSGTRKNYFDRVSKHWLPNLRT